MKSSSKKAPLKSGAKPSMKGKKAPAAKAVTHVGETKPVKTAKKKA